MQIKYKNSIGSFITDQQVKELNEYNKITYQDNEIKTIESFISSKTKNQTVISYFLDDREDKQVIVEQNTSVIENKSCLIYFNKESKNGFNLWDIEEYNSEGILRFKSKEAYDNKHRLVFMGKFNNDTDILESGSFKFYYLNKYEDEYKDRLLKITYDEHGDVDVIIDINDHFDYYKAPSLDEFLADDVGQILFPWNEHPYYHSAYPFLPESPNI
ncbi:MAG: hypothetical protein J7577_13030 [Sphingobacteriaceae bacterium]|nr:hypothetical protein [Sphingobacteriaceae bacterium]